MRFLLKAGDLIRVRHAPLSELRSGDVVVLLDWRPGPPEYVVHRLLGRLRRGGAHYAVTKGDANLLPDPLSPESAVVGVVDAVLAQGTWRSLDAAARPRGLLIAALGAPIYRVVFEADRLGWTRPPMAARRVLRGLLPAYVRSIQRVYDWLQESFAEFVLGEAISGPPAIGDARPVFGIIDDQTWSGRIKIEGDVFVPSGVTLRIESGTEITFRDESRWDCLRELRLWGDPSKNIEGKCRLLIAGRVIAAGTKDAPISIGGSDWGGIHFVADSWGSDLTRVSIRRSLDAAVTLHDSAQAALEFAEISDCGSGIVLLGAGTKAELDDCRIERCARRGITVVDGAMSARRIAILDCGEVGVFAAAAALELQDGTLAGAPVGFSQNGGSARLIRVKISRAKNAGLELDGGEYTLTDSAAADCGEALRSGGAALGLKDFKIENCGSGVSLRSGKLNWSGGAASGGRFGLESWDADAIIERVAYLNQSIAAVRAERGSLSIRGGSFARARLGVQVSGGVAAMNDVRFEDCIERAMSIDSEARLRAERLDVRGGADAIAARNAELDIEGFKAAGHTGAAVRVAQARLDLKDAAISGGEVGILAEHGDVRLNGCAVLDIAGNGAAFIGGSLTASRCRFEDVARVGVYVSEGGAVALADCSFSGGEAGILAERGDVRLNECGIMGVAGNGAELIGGSLTASRCRFEDVARAGVYMSEGAAAVLTDCSLRRMRYGIGVAAGDTRLDAVRIIGASAVGFSAASGRHSLNRVTFHGCTDRIHVGKDARVDFVKERPGGFGVLATVKGWLRAAVLWTSRISGMRTVYRALYALPVGVLRFWAALDGNVDALYGHRSWVQRDWEPGISDIDLLVSARGLAGEAGRVWLQRFWRRFGLLKCVFPFLGECLVVEPAELCGHAAWGGFRARGAADYLLPLSGRSIVATARPASLKVFLEPAGELAHAYTRLMSSALWRPDPSAAGRRAAINAALDMTRIRGANDVDGPVQLPSRASALAAAVAPASALRAPLAALKCEGSPRARAQLCAEGLLSLHEASTGVLAAWPSAGASKLRRFRPQAAPSSRANVELRRRRGLVGEYADVCAGALVAGCADDLYRTCLVVEDHAAQSETLIRLFEGLTRFISVRGEPATLPIVLTVSAWKVWSRLAYLESPTRFLDLGIGTEDILVGGGALFPDAWLYSWGRERLVAQESPDDLVLDLARESLSTARCVWRWQSGDLSPLSPAYIQHYLLGRTMGLRLILERGILASFFDLDLLRSLYIQEFPERAAQLERLWGNLALREGPAPWSELYVWVDAELRGY
ncbi:MAG: hypothetical protein HKL90_06995 [Elusimicrobia bacterium]|nr:hypothetical protein [Elusimicrobiota bacterium]